MSGLMKARADRTVVPKGWGHEDWVVNKSEYCGKRLVVLVGKKCSWHYHVLKDETFYIESGTVVIRHSEGDDIGAASETVLGPGSSFYVPRGLRHQFEGVTDAVIFEFSTQHFDDDSYRITRGD